MAEQCRQCGAALAADAKFCAQCGTTVTAAKKARGGVSWPVSILMMLFVATVVFVGSRWAFNAQIRPCIEATTQFMTTESELVKLMAEIIEAQAEGDRRHVQRLALGFEGLMHRMEREAAAVAACVE